ncbi:MAG TPA: NAD(P)/FAD-dependent oxidoreductase [Puia sp.]|nr:NAD(P)/FAD-dependent oxidoreductase [Puia sp.]
MKRFDVLIIGSGMGGLVCANVLAREGYRVCVVERNKQFGGCLQVYARNKVIFDAGVHYLGGLDKGQNLHQIFKWLGVLDKLRLERMDENFDQILFDSDEKSYPIAQGYDAFIRHLVEIFPGEESAIRKYCETIISVCDQFPMYRLRTQEASKTEALASSAKQFIEGLTNNEKLRAVLAGNIMLYAGHGDKTPLYVHALTVNSYIESAWRCINGGSQITKALTANIHAAGGTLLRNSEVAGLHETGGRISHVLLKDGTTIEADHFISNTTPANTYRLTNSRFIRPATRNRLEQETQTVSSFVLNIVFKPNCFPYVKHNYYYHKAGTLWNMQDYKSGDWPLGYAIYLSSSSHTKEFADGMTIFAYMRYEEVEPWSAAFNTVAHPGDRGEGYVAFKKQRAEQLLNRIEEKFPGIRNCIKTYYAATPLSYRDYIGNDDGNLYGVEKDYRTPMASLISPRTRIPNLYLTGQSLNLHGILGTAISGLITASALTGKNDFIEKIRNA